MSRRLAMTVALTFVAAAACGSSSAAEQPLPTPAVVAAATVCHRTSNDIKALQGVFTGISERKYATPDDASSAIETASAPLTTDADDAQAGHYDDLATAIVGLRKAVAHVADNVNPTASGALGAELHQVAMGIAAVRSACAYRTKP